MKDTPRSIPLYRLADMREQLEAELFFSDGVLSPEQERRFDAIAGSAEKKLARAGLRILEDEATAKIIALEVPNRIIISRMNSFRRSMSFCWSRRRSASRSSRVRLLAHWSPSRSRANSSLTVTTVEPADTGPQKDLFARRRSPIRRSHRGNHVRVR